MYGYIKCRWPKSVTHISKKLSRARADHLPVDNLTHGCEGRLIVLQFYCKQDNMHKLICRHSQHKGFAKTCRTRQDYWDLHLFTGLLLSLSRALDQAIMTSSESNKLYIYLEEKTSIQVTHF